MIKQVRPPKYVHQPTVDRFWSFVNKRNENECWLWTGSTYVTGYGQARIGSRQGHAHRFAFEFAVGLPGNLQVCHKCDTPLCCNPSHLFLGTAKENVRDAIQKGRRNYQGENSVLAILTEENVHEIRRRLATGEFQKKIAKDFGVTQEAISHIKLKKRWGWLENENNS